MNHHDDTPLHDGMDHHDELPDVAHKLDVLHSPLELLQGNRQALDEQLGKLEQQEELLVLVQEQLPERRQAFSVQVLATWQLRAQDAEFLLHRHDADDASVQDDHAAHHEQEQLQELPDGVDGNDVGHDDHHGVDEQQQGLDGNDASDDVHHGHNDDHDA